MSNDDLLKLFRVWIDETYKSTGKIPLTVDEPKLVEQRLMEIFSTVVDWKELNNGTNI